MEFKPHSDFSNERKSTDGKKSQCKSCISIYMMDYTSKNKNKKAEYDSHYRAKNKEIIYLKKLDYRVNNKQKLIQYRKDNAVHRRRKTADWIKNNIEYVLKKRVIDYQLNRESLIEKSRAYKRANKEKIKLYKLNNKGMINANTAKRHAQKLKATPVWANHWMISEIYDLAFLRSQTTNIKWHVDHVIPLQGRNVCGLHVENNLNVIPAVINLKKHNHHV